jgi:hypothetical protein
VCDRCNNYFASKIEQPVLNSDYFRHARFRNAIPNKKGRIPTLEVIFGPNGEELGMYRTTKGLQGIYPLDQKSANSWLSHLFREGGGTIYIPKAQPACVRDVSRFLAKMALEILAYRVSTLPGWYEAVVGKVELDEIRKYARYGQGPTWPFYERRIYPEHQKREMVGIAPYEVLHEFDLLYTSWQELFAVICIFGVEYTINLGGPEIEGYLRWLNENNNTSYLYSGKNSEPNK